MVRRCALAVLSLCAGLALSAAAEGPASKDLKAMQGDWLVVENKVDGLDFPKDLLKKTKVIFKGDKMTQKPEIVNACGKFILGSADGFTVSVKLDESKKPKLLDVIVEADGKKAVAKGIYELRGDDLKICFNPGGAPKEFTSKAGSGNILLVLKREKKKGK
jgi:uncharacterized protein (TIGR03067 family)